MRVTAAGGVDDEQRRLSKIVTLTQTRCLALPLHFHLAANDDKKALLALSLGCNNGSARIMHGEEGAARSLRSDSGSLANQG